VQTILFGIILVDRGDMLVVVSCASKINDPRPRGKLGLWRRIGSIEDIDSEEDPWQERVDVADSKYLFNVVGQKMFRTNVCH